MLLLLGLVGDCLVYILRPLVQTVQVAEAIAGGDLTQETKTGRRDEVGTLMKGMSTFVDRFVV